MKMYLRKKQQQQHLDTPFRHIDNDLLNWIFDCFFFVYVICPVNDDIWLHLNIIQEFTLTVKVLKEVDAFFLLEFRETHFDRLVMLLAGMKKLKK